MAYDAPATDDFDPLLPDDDLSTLPLDEVVKEAIDARLLGVHVAQPGRITAITAEQTVSVQLLLQTRRLDATTAEDQPILQRVPVAMAMGQGFLIKLPIAVGDLGLVLFSDRSLDTFLASDGSQTADPADVRMHSVNDAVFLPGLPTTSQNTTDGTTDLVLGAGQGGTASQVRLRADGKIQLKNSSQELLALVDQTLTGLQSAQAMTAFGPAPLDAATLQLLSQLHTALSSLKV